MSHKNLAPCPPLLLGFWGLDFSFKRLKNAAIRESKRGRVAKNREKREKKEKRIEKEEKEREFLEIFF